jgi:hypothetical protein
VSDPFERLRDLPGAAGEPDVAAIRRRARSIQARRYTTLGAAAGLSVLVLAIVVVAQRPGQERAKSLASRPAAAPELTERRDATAEAFGAGDAATTAATPVPQALAGAPKSAGSAAAGNVAPRRMSEGAQAPQGELEVSLKLAKTTLAPGEPLPMTVTACNKTSRTIDASYPTAQRYDFEITRGGSPVWRWSRGRSFAQVVGGESWASGQCRDYSEQWMQTNDDGRPAGPGAYDVTGVLTTMQPKRTASQRVCVLPC